MTFCTYCRYVRALLVRCILFFIRYSGKFCANRATHHRWNSRASFVVWWYRHLPTRWNAERKREREKSYTTLPKNLVKTYNVVHSSHHEIYSLLLFFYFNSGILCISRAFVWDACMLCQWSLNTCHIHALPQTPAQKGRCKHLPLMQHFDSESP